MTDANLSSIFPTRKENIIEAVRQCGHDITPWGFTKGGTVPFDAPAVNPNYCYRWSFRQDGSPTLLCLWHKDLSEDGSRIFYIGNSREEALRLARTTENPKATAKEINRARKRAREAIRMNTNIMDAFRLQTPIKVAIVHTKKTFRDDLEPASADLRQLDHATWIVKRYDMATGAYELERDAVYQDSEQKDDTYEDQFSGTDCPQYVTKTGDVVIRDHNVRLEALARSKGHCEYCGEKGFTTKSGKIYLETHHIVPLAEGGPDRIYNVIALCPNHHMQAHFSADAEEFTEKLTKLMSQI